MNSNNNQNNQPNAGNMYGVPPHGNPYQMGQNYGGQVNVGGPMNTGQFAVPSGYAPPGAPVAGSVPLPGGQITTGQQPYIPSQPNSSSRPSYSVNQAVSTQPPVNSSNSSTGNLVYSNPPYFQPTGQSSQSPSYSGSNYAQPSTGMNYPAGGQSQPSVYPVAANTSQSTAQQPMLSAQMSSLSLNNPQSHPSHTSSRPSYDTTSMAYSPMVQTAPPAGGNKIPSDQIPCPIDVRNADQETFNSFGSYRTSLDISPPLSTTQVSIVDDGNCHPSFLRLTTFKIPPSSDILNQSGITFGIVIQPFASVPYEIPVIDCSSGTGLERCKNCMAYINPFIIFGTGGRRYKCNICMQDNELKGESVMDQSYAGAYSGQQTVYRPELKYGTVEFIVPPEYVQRPKAQTEPFLLFVIDVSKPALLPVILNAIKNCINFIEAASIYRYVSLVAYDRIIHFFDVSNPSNPSIVTAPDLKADYAPIAFHQFMYDIVSLGVGGFVDLLDNLPLYFEKSSRNDVSLSSCVKFILNAVEEHNGKMVLFNTSHFGTGPDCLTLRDDVSPAQDKEKTMLTALKSDLGDVAQRAAQNGIAVEFFALSTDNFLDLASTSPLSSLSGGDLYYYQSIQFLKSNCLSDDLLHCISQVKAFDCAAKLRTSNGISVADNFGPIYMRTSGEMLFGNASESKTVACLLQVDDKIPEKAKVSFQFAALYTDSRGIRRVRVHNLCVPVATNIFDLFGHSDCEAVCNFLSKRAVSLVTSDPMNVIRDLVAQRISLILGGYRKHCSPNTSVTQLVLPESLKLLPIYLLSLLKTKAFNAFSIKSDLRIFWIRLINSLSVRQMAYLCYPRLYCLTDGSFPEEYLDAENVFPTPLLLSMENVNPTQVYCISNGIFIIVFIGSAVEPQTIQNLFGVNSLQLIDPIRLSAGLPVLDTPLSICARKLVQKFQEQMSFNARSPVLFVVRQGMDSMEHEFTAMLVHDQSGGIPAYVDYLCSLHSSVKGQIKK